MTDSTKASTISVKSKGLPTRQHLVGWWLLLGGGSLAGGMVFAAWFESQFVLSPLQRILVWLLSLSGGATFLCLGYLIERALLTPLRRLHETLAGLVARPNANFKAIGGWLSSLEPDIQHIAQHWCADRERLLNARDEGACEAMRIRRELEGLLQHLAMPILLFDNHRRLLLFNHAAESLLISSSKLGLGKRLEALLPDTQLGERFDLLASLDTLEENFTRELLIELDERTLSISLTRLPYSPHPILITLKDVKRFWNNELVFKRRIASTLKTLEQYENITAPLAELKRLLDGAELNNERLSSVWSNAFWKALDEQLNPAQQLITPIGIPGWFKGHQPSLIALFNTLISKLQGHFPGQRFEGELVRAPQGTWLAFIWPGACIGSDTLTNWQSDPVTTLPGTPSVRQILNIHGSSLWSEADSDGINARLCVSLRTSRRTHAPPSAREPRPEFHDFDIAYLSSPVQPLSECPLEQLPIVAFDTETTGLDLRNGDRAISLGACRIINRRLLAGDVFESFIDPCRSIPPHSSAIHGILDSDVADAPPLKAVLNDFLRYAEGAALLAHNASFDLLALSPAGKIDGAVLDTLLISRALDPSLNGHDLDTLIKRYDLFVPEGIRHTALGDAQLTAELWLALLPRLKARGINTLADLLAFYASGLNTEDGTR